MAQLAAAYGAGLATQPVLNRVPAAGTSLATQTVEWVSMPHVMLGLVALSVMYGWPKANEKAARKAENMSKYGGNMGMWIDTKLNTDLKDQSGGAGLSVTRPQSFATVKQRITSDYRREQLAAPGVNLVAHAVI